MSDKGWIGVDLDSSLAEYHGWIAGGKIGPPIPKMVNRVKQFLADGKKVKIMTARVSNKNIQGLEGERALQEKLIQEWCLEHLGQVLEITCEKDLHMYILYDDRACQLVPNEGVTLEEIIKEKDEIINRLREALVLEADKVSRLRFPDTTGGQGCTGFGYGWGV